MHSAVALLALLAPLVQGGGSRPVTTFSQLSKGRAGLSEAPEGEIKPQFQTSIASKLPTLLMLKQAGLISDSDLRQQMATSLFSKGSPQERELQVGGGDLVQTMMLMNALGGQKQEGGRGQGAMGAAILGGGDPIKSMLISSALSNPGQADSLLPILLMSSAGKDKEQRSGSCVGKCGSAVPRQDCGCDIACRQNGDCCPDFDFACFVQDVQPYQQISTVQVPQQYPIQGGSFPQFQQGQQGFQQGQQGFQQGQQVTGQLQQPKLGKARET